MNLAIAAVSTLLSLLVAFLAIKIYLGHCRNLGVDGSRQLARSKYTRSLFVDRDYKKLIKEVFKDKANDFTTVTDFNETIALSRSLFIPTEMFGEPRYVYRPHMRMCNASVWTGLVFDRLIVHDNERVDELITHCHTSRLVCFTTDANGFKNEDAAYQASGPTILFLGDSFTEGLWVAMEASFPRQFAELLRGRNISARVLNLGVNGYSAMEMRWILEHIGPSLSPRIVIMNLFLNDVDTDYFKNDIPEKNYMRMFAHIDKALQCAERLGSSLTISIVPAMEQFTERRDQLTFQKRVKAWCVAHEVSCLDPYDFFDHRGGEKLYLGWDPHFNEEGHRVYAEFLAAELHAEIAERCGGSPVPGEQLAKLRDLETEF